MPEIGTSGSMSGDGKRSVGHRPQATAPILDSTIASCGFRQQWEHSGLVKPAAGNDCALTVRQRSGVPCPAHDFPAPANLIPCPAN
jgi:hypothetical protein